MEFQSSEYQFFFENDLDDDLVQFEMESKGYLYGTVIKITKGNSYRINFYDSTRFKQDVDDELKTASYYYEENVVMIEKVTKENILKAINDIVIKKAYNKMTATN